MYIFYEKKKEDNGGVKGVMGPRIWDKVKGSIFFFHFFPSSIAN